jgi:outer membrane lipoprotein SlyB
VKKALVVVAALALLGCAAHAPLVDTKGVDMNQYHIDLKECQAYAEQTYGAGTGAVAGAVAGALLGELLARAGGGMSVRGQLAGSGAVLGAAAGGGEGFKNQREVVQRCMSGRGYRVLN